MKETAQNLQKKKTKIIKKNKRRNETKNVFVCAVRSVSCRFEITGYILSLLLYFSVGALTWTYSHECWNITETIPIQCVVQTKHERSLLIIYYDWHGQQEDSVCCSVSTEYLRSDPSVCVRVSARRRSHDTSVGIMDATIILIFPHVSSFSGSRWVCFCCCKKTNGKLTKRYDNTSYSYTIQLNGSWNKCEKVNFH